MNNPVTLFRRGPAEVRAEVRRNLEAGVGIIGPECAVPLETPLENLREIPRAVAQTTGDRSTINSFLRSQ